MFQKINQISNQQEAYTYQTKYQQSIKFQLKAYTYFLSTHPLLGVLIPILHFDYLILFAS